jgi:hypothetical protein
LDLTFAYEGRSGWVGERQIRSTSRNHTASRKSIETFNGGSRRAFRACCRADFRVIIRRKSESPLASATIARKLAALLQHFGANEDESCRECGDRLNFVSVKPKMIF